MRSQHSIYAKVQNWLQTEDEPSDAQLVEIEKAYQDWSKQFNDSLLPWDWEMKLLDSEPQENPDEWYSDQETEDEEDLYDLD